MWNGAISTQAPGFVAHFNVKAQYQPNGSYTMVTSRNEYRQSPPGQPPKKKQRATINGPAIPTTTEATIYHSTCCPCDRHQYPQYAPQIANGLQHSSTTGRENYHEDRSTRVHQHYVGRSVNSHSHTDSTRTRSRSPVDSGMYNIVQAVPSQQFYNRAIPVPPPIINTVPAYPIITSVPTWHHMDFASPIQTAIQTVPVVQPMYNPHNTYIPTIPSGDISPHSPYFSTTSTNTPLVTGQPTIVQQQPPIVHAQHTSHHQVKKKPVVHPRSPRSRSKSQISLKTNSTKDDEIIHFDWKIGQKLSNSQNGATYIVENMLGEGTFGRVLGARTVARPQYVEARGDNIKHDRKVAIKVVRDVPRYMDNAKIEAKILNEIREKDPSNKSRCLRMYDNFIHKKKFYCIVTEPLGVSLYDFLKSNSFIGYYLDDITQFAIQCLEALDFLKDIKLAHTDLKPENILLVDNNYQKCKPPRPTRSSKDSAYMRPARPRIKLIDFGNATFQHEFHSAIVNTRQYRSPEVILNNGWNESGDLWCLGCIFIELYTGDLFFNVHHNLQHLAMMEKLIGPFPKRILDKITNETKVKYFQYFPAEGQTRVHVEAVTPKERKTIDDAKGVHSLISTRKHNQFATFCMDLMKLDKDERLTPKKMMEHAFFKAGPFND